MSRLLVLGAGPYQLPVIERAMELGCHVIAADYIATNPGHRVAHASAVASTVDLEAMLAVARKHEIDGVLTYGSDVSAPAVSYIAERLGLPGNSFETAALLQRKDRIRALQRELGLPHPRFVAGSSVEELLDPPLPALFKPADSSGSKGQTVVRNRDEVAAAFETARVFSRCGVVVAEELLPDDTTELVFEAYIEDGRLVFGHYGHNWFCDDVHPRVPSGEMVPGDFDDAMIAEIDRQIQTLVTGAGVRTGCMNFDALLSRGEVVIVDIGLRSGGNFVPEVVRLSTGVDLTTAAIHAALGKRFEVPSLHVANARCILAQILHSHVAGRFEALEVSIDLIAEHLFVSPGDEVKPFTRGDAAVGVAIFEQPSVGAAYELIKRMPHPCRVLVQPSSRA